MTTSGHARAASVLADQLFEDGLQDGAGKAQSEERQREGHVAQREDRREERYMKGKRQQAGHGRGATLEGAGRMARRRPSLPSPKRLALALGGAPGLAGGLLGLAARLFGLPMGRASTTAGITWHVGSLASNLGRAG